MTIKPLTHGLVIFVVVCVAKMFTDSLLAVERAHRASGASMQVRLRESLLADTKRIKAEAMDIGRQMGELAETIVCMTMECINEDGVIELASARSKRGVVQCDSKGAPNVEPRALVWPVCVHQPFRC